MSLAGSVKEAVLWVSGFIVPVFQFVPNSWMFWGPMSMPLISYFSSLSHLPHLFDEITAMLFDFSFLFGWHGAQEFAGVVLASFLILFLRGLIVGGLVLFIYSLYYLLTRRDELVCSGPYRWVRHPQYLGLLMMTAGITVGVIRTNPVWVWGDRGSSIAGAWILIIWFLQLTAYIILGKIEDVHLRSKFGKTYAEYSKHVPFIVP